MSGTDREPKAARDDLAARANELIEQAKPRVRRLIKAAQPRADAAGREAVRYVKTHQGEIKQAASLLARYQLRGPLGLVAQALTAAAPGSPQAANRCPACQTANVPVAKFCNECGTRLTPPA